MKKILSILTLLVLFFAPFAGANTLRIGGPGIGSGLVIGGPGIGFYQPTDQYWFKDTDFSKLEVNADAGRFPGDVAEDVATFEEGKLVGCEAYIQLVMESEDVGGVNWVTDHVTISGTDLILENTDNSAHGVYQSIAMDLSGTYTLSAMLKGNGRDWSRLTARLSDNSFIRAWYNLSTGVVGTVEAGATATIESMGDDWFLCSMTFTNAGAGVTATRAYTICSKLDNETAYIGDVTRGLYSTEIQLTKSPYQLPYAPNDSAVATLSVPANNSSNDGTQHGYYYTIASHHGITDAFDGVDSGPATSETQIAWTPKFNQGDIGAAFNIFSLNNSDTGGPWYDDVNSLIKFTDGTNTAEVAHTAVNGEQVTISIVLDGANSQMVIGVDSTGGTPATFDGHVPLGDYWAYFWDAEYQIVGAPKIYKKIQHTEWLP